MYGLIEVFCLIYFDFVEVDYCFDLIGKVVFNVCILVVCFDGLWCVFEELGEFVYVGVCVMMGYWGDVV